MVRIATDLEIPLAIDGLGAEPAYKQLAAQLTDAIRRGLLLSDQQLPSSRLLAARLAVSRGVVLDAIELLRTEGLLMTRPGAGTFVRNVGAQSRDGDEQRAPGTEASATEGTAPAASWLRGREGGYDDNDSAGLVNFAGALPSSIHIPRADWIRSWTRAARAPMSDHHSDGLGEPVLRRALAIRLAVTRGIECSPDDIVVTAGGGQAIDLIARSAMNPGDVVLVEDPGYPHAWTTLSHYGRVQPVPVDENGIRADLIAQGEADSKLVYVTPSHQFPMGFILDQNRRAQLLAWARSRGALIVEDDYESEFRFDQAPVPALAALDEARDNVVYIGTFTKILTPSIRVGFVVAPRPLTERLAHFKRMGQDHTPAVVQLAVADMIVSGALDRHVRRMRTHYGKLRRQLLERLTAIPDAHVRGIAGGLHLVLELPDDVDAELVARRCLADGLVVRTLDRYQISSRRNAIVLGYWGLTMNQVDWATSVLIAATKSA